MSKIRNLCVYCFLYYKNSLFSLKFPIPLAQVTFNEKYMLSDGIVNVANSAHLMDIISINFEYIVESNI